MPPTGSEREHRLDPLFSCMMGSESDRFYDGRRRCMMMPRRDKRRVRPVITLAEKIRISVGGKWKGRRDEGEAIRRSGSYCGKCLLVGDKTTRNHFSESSEMRGGKQENTRFIYHRLLKHNVGLFAQRVRRKWAYVRPGERGDEGGRREGWMEGGFFRIHVASSLFLTPAHPPAPAAPGPAPLPHTT